MAVGIGTSRRYDDSKLVRDTEVTNHYVYTKVEDAIAIPKLAPIVSPKLTRRFEDEDDEESRLGFRHAAIMAMETYKDMGSLRLAAWVVEGMFTFLATRQAPVPLSEWYECAYNANATSNNGPEAIDADISAANRGLPLPRPLLGGVAASATGETSRVRGGQVNVHHLAMLFDWDKIDRDEQMKMVRLRRHNANDFETEFNEAIGDGEILWVQIDIRTIWAKLANRDFIPNAKTQHLQKVQWHKDVAKEGGDAVYGYIRENTTQWTGTSAQRYALQEQMVFSFDGRVWLQIMQEVIVPSLDVTTHPLDEQSCKRFVKADNVTSLGYIIAYYSREDVLQLPSQIEAFPNDAAVFDSEHEYYPDCIASILDCPNLVSTDDMNFSTMDVDKCERLRNVLVQQQHDMDERVQATIVHMERSMPTVTQIATNGKRLREKVIWPPAKSNTDNYGALHSSMHKYIPFMDKFVVETENQFGPGTVSAEDWITSLTCETGTCWLDYGDDKADTYEGHPDAPKWRRQTRRLQWAREIAQSRAKATLRDMRWSVQHNAVLRQTITADTEVAVLGFHNGGRCANSNIPWLSPAHRVQDESSPRGISMENLPSQECP